MLKLINNVSESSYSRKGNNLQAHLFESDSSRNDFQSPPSNSSSKAIAIFPQSLTSTAASVQSSPPPPKEIRVSQSYVMSDLNDSDVVGKTTSILEW